MGRGMRGAELGRVVGRENVSTYRTINNPLVPRIIIDIDRHAAKCADLGCKFIEARVVLSGHISSAVL